MCDVRANQNADSPVRTRPLSGISVGRTTSNGEIRSLATRSRRSSSSANSSRTFPLATWTTASGMNGFLLCGESAQALEDGVDVPDGCFEVEDGVQIDACGDLRIGFDELPEVCFPFPCLHGVVLNEPVGVVPRDARLDERKQQAMAEHEPMTRIEVATHPFR